jgi:hypothetical protein
MNSFIATTSEWWGNNKFLKKLKNSKVKKKTLPCMKKLQIRFKSIHVVHL